MTKNDSDTIALISRLRSLGIRLWAEDDRLRIDAPKGVLNSSLREELSRSKSDIMRVINVWDRSAPADPVPIQTIARDGNLPLSFSQLRLWFLQELDPMTSAYNLRVLSRIKGFLDLKALEKCFNEIVARHESLRTTFMSSDGEPYQVVSDYCPFPLQVLDMRDVPEASREEKAIQLAAAEGERPFDLTNGPLMRITLIKLADDEHMLLVVMHHIISDGWSFRVLLKELTVLYDAFTRGLPPKLPELLVQYPDYAHWQRQYMDGKVLEDHLSYWKKQLSNSPAVLNLPTDRPRPSAMTYSGAHKTIRLSKRLSGALKALGHEQGSLFMVLLAALKILLFRYTGQEDISVGTYIANRNRKEIEGLIGFFVNTLVMRTSLSGNPTFRELCLRVQDVAFGAYANQDLPFEVLLNALKIERTMSHTPLFQVMLVLQNVPYEKLQLAQLSDCAIYTEMRRANFDLELWMWEEGHYLSGTLEYSLDLFDEATIDRMIEHFNTLLESIVKDVDQPISLLPILPDAERERLLVHFNDGGKAPKSASGEPEACVHHLFEAQAASHPEALALVSENERLTYGQLNQRANRLAHYLRAQGVAREVCVALFMERCVDLVVALLAILKAGGAYLPLES